MENTFINDASFAEDNAFFGEQAANEIAAEHDYAMYQLCLLAMRVFPGTPDRGDMENYIEQRDLLKVTDEQVAEYATRYLTNRIGQCVSEFEGRAEPLPF